MQLIVEFVLFDPLMQALPIIESKRRSPTNRIFTPESKMVPGVGANGGFGVCGGAKWG